MERKERLSFQINYLLSQRRFLNLGASPFHLEPNFLGSDFEPLPGRRVSLSLKRNSLIPSHPCKVLPSAFVNEDGSNEIFVNFPSESNSISVAKESRLITSLFGFSE